MVKSKIISIGDELLNGQVINTNATYISEHLSKAGFDVKCIVSLGDDEIDLIKELNDSREHFDLTIITGGLGPTHDDITKGVITDYFKDILKLREDILEHVKFLFSRREISMPEVNRNQALFPSKAEIIWNENGTAPGILYNDNGKLFIALPGVPYEMKPMIENFVIPKIKNIFSDKLNSYCLTRTILTTGISESALSEIIGDVEKLSFGNKFAFLPSFYGVRLRIDVKSDSKVNAVKDLNIIVNNLKSILGEFIYGYDSELMESIIGKLLLKYSKTLSVAESCTGGLISKRITDVPGSSRYFKGSFCTYSNESKIELLGVNENTIFNFGAVSDKTAMEMAAGVMEKFGTDYALSVTGISGPDGGNLDKPVGLTYIGYCDKKNLYSLRYNFGDNRERNRIRASQAALNILRKELIKIVSD